MGILHAQRDVLAFHVSQLCEPFAETLHHELLSHANGKDSYLVGTPWGAC